MTRILIVEDDPSIALALSDDLSLEGYEVVTAKDGTEGIQTGRERNFDLILLDLMLPRKAGLDVLRELRREGVRTPVIVLTAKTHEAEKVLGLELGADDYVTKPFSPMELRARIKAVLRRAEGRQLETYRFGEWTVDFNRFELSRSGESVLLTPLEFKLLAAFIRNRGRVLDRNQILDLVWGSGTFVTDRVVDTHIANLRKKIEPDPSQPRFLVGVRGVGYRFDG